MRFRLETLLIAVFLIGSVSLLARFSIKKPHILIVQSYATDYSWVNDVNVGLNRVLDQHHEYSVRSYYLDTKRHPSAEYKARAGVAARRMIDAAPPDILIAVDDDAQQYVARYYINHPRIKIVFSGVNNEPQEYGYDTANNVTGILQRLPLAALKETLLVAAQRNSLKSPLRIQFIGDNSKTVVSDEKFFRSYDWAPIKILDSKLVNTYGEWQQAVKHSASNVDVLITSNYRLLKRSVNNSAFIPKHELVAWTEKYSPVPVIGTNGFYVEDGGMLAVGTSPYEQGEAAAKLAVNMLEHGTTPQKLPFLDTTQFIVAIRASAMRHRDFSLPLVYESSARAINKYYE